MKKCAIIICYVNNKFRQELLRKQVDFFNQLGIDPIVVSSDHVGKVDGVANYITTKHVCTNLYLSKELHAYSAVGDRLYFRWEPYNNISSKNFFIKLFQCTFSYCRNLGYDFCYVLDFDNIIKAEHVSIAFSENLDFSKVYFYKFDGSDGYQGAFLYGNLEVLKDIFSVTNLDYLENVAKQGSVYTNEQAYAILANQFKNNIVVLTYAPNEVYSARNMFSSSNIADFYFCRNLKEYYFIQVKGDTCENEFGCELLKDDLVIFSNKMNVTSAWFIDKLENNVKYTVKYYDGEISPDTLSKTITIYTDPDNPTTKNWIQTN